MRSTASGTMFVRRWRGRAALVRGLLFMAIVVAPGVGAAAEEVTAETVTGRPQRIVTLAPNAAEIICALGAGDRIVAVSRYCVYPDELKGRPRIGGLFDPNLERMAALRPDLLVLRGQNEEIDRLASQLGAKVFHDKTESLADIPANIRRLGELLGRTAEAERLCTEFEGRVAKLKKLMADRRRPRVLVTVSRSPDEITNVLTAGKGTFLHEAVELAGGSNVFGNLEVPWPQVTPEAILAARPSVIIEFQPEVEPSEDLERRLRAQWARLGPLPAASAGRIHIITADHALIPSPRFLDIVEEMAKLLHPELADALKSEANHKADGVDRAGDNAAGSEDKAGDRNDQPELKSDAAPDAGARPEAQRAEGAIR
jgi:iron complex transport system substrate-binding protein